MIPKVKHLVIAGQKIELEVSPISNQNINNDGMCWTTKGVIWVSKDAPDFLQRQIVLHETLHMIDNLYSLGDLGEMVISTFANTLLQFIQDNPKIIDWLKDGNNER